MAAGFLNRSNCFISHPYICTSLDQLQKMQRSCTEWEQILCLHFLGKQRYCIFCLATFVQTFTTRCNCCRRHHSLKNAKQRSL